MTDITFKICIFGDGGVGKTTLTERFMTGLFKDDTVLTIGSNFYRKNLSVEGKNVSLQIWDFAGERKFRSLFPGYVKGASGCIFMYDITRYTSIKNFYEWMKSLEEGLGENPEIPILMVGGKKDLEDKRAFDKKLADDLVQEYGFTDHIECSAKTGLNVEEIFLRLTRIMMKNHDFI